MTSPSEPEVSVDILPIKGQDDLVVEATFTLPPVAAGVRVKDGGPVTEYHRQKAIRTAVQLVWETLSGLTPTTEVLQELVEVRAE